MNDSTSTSRKVRLRILTAVVLISWPPSGWRAAALCEGDFDGDNAVSIGELITAVGNALDGCPPPLPTETPTSTETRTPTLTPTQTDTPSPTATDTPPSRCGDGHADTDEECDGADLNNRACSDATGARFGVLSCTDACLFETSGCSDSRFDDQGNGTIRDNRTGLVWEKKCSVCDNRHDVDYRYPWQGTCSGSTAECRSDDDCDAAETCDAVDGQGTGMTIFEWVEALNNDQFGGSGDWRVPTISELETIRNLSTFDPSAFTDFHRNACANLSDPDCSRTRSSNYWSATTQAGKAASAWSLNFDEGSTEAGDTADPNFVRAVSGEARF